MAEAKKKPVAVAKKVEAKVAEKKAEVKEVAKKVEAKTAEVKAAAEKKVAEKKAPAKAAAEKKAPAKKAPAKKAPAKKVETKASLNVQFMGKDYKEADLIKMAKDAYKKAGNKDALKTINVYANIDDQVAYYVANGSIEGKFEI